MAHGARVGPAAVDGTPLSSLDTAERAAFYRYSFLFSSYAIRSWYYETVDLSHKLFLTSIISFIAPHTSVQVVGAPLSAPALCVLRAVTARAAAVALMFAFGMVLFVTQVKPYREPANNQLVALAHINIFLFLFTVRARWLRPRLQTCSEHAAHRDCYCKQTRTASHRTRWCSAS
jgi:hypothetical protein